MGGGVGPSRRRGRTGSRVLAGVCVGGDVPSDACVMHCCLICLIHVCNSETLPYLVTCGLLSSFSLFTCELVPVLTRLEGSPAVPSLA